MNTELFEKARTLHNRITWVRSNIKYIDGMLHMAYRFTLSIRKTDDDEDKGIRMQIDEAVRPGLVLIRDGLVEQLEKLEKDFAEI